MPTQRRCSKRLQEKANVINPRRAGATLLTTKPRPKANKVTQKARGTPRRAADALAQTGRVLWTSATPNANNRRTEPSLAIPNSDRTETFVAATSPVVRETDLFQEWREAIHDIRRYIDPSLPPLHEMLGEPCITSESYSDRYMFDQSYEVSRGLVNSLRRSIVRSESVEHGKMRKMDHCLAERETYGLGYLGLKRKRVLQQDLVKKMCSVGWTRGD